MEVSFGAGGCVQAKAGSRRARLAALPRPGSSHNPAPTRRACARAPTARSDAPRVPRRSTDDLAAWERRTHRASKGRHESYDYYAMLDLQDKRWRATKEEVLDAYKRANLRRASLASPRLSAC